VGTRETVEVEAEAISWDYAPLEPFQEGADDYLLSVSAEVGVVLRLASRLGGEELDVFEMVDLAFDEAIAGRAIGLREEHGWVVGTIQAGLRGRPHASFGASSVRDRSRRTWLIHPGSWYCRSRQSIIAPNDARHLRRILYPLPTTARVRAASGV
jgi:hypothetical protein